MALLMDLVAGDAREVLLALSVEDWAGLDDPDRFAGHVGLGGGLDPVWLDLFAEAARSVAPGPGPGSFLEACYPLADPGLPGPTAGERTVERVSAAWVEAVARVPDDRLDRLAAAWVDLVEREEVDVDPDDKPMLRALAGDLVRFARTAVGAPDVLFAWSL
ncbi:MAG TPA: hypothetical protein VF763_02465 [Candidatus Limnocylindrales bacterium]